MADEWAEWTRVRGVDECPLDLMWARMARHFAPHIHEEYSIGVCTSGVETIRYRGAAHLSGPGTVVILEPGEPHTGGPADDRFTYKVMYPRVGLLGEGLPAPHFPSGVVDDPWLADELLRTHAALTGGAEPFAAESRLVEMLTAVVCRHATPVPDLADRRDAPLVRAVMDRLAAELTDPPSLAGIAADLGRSRYHVLRTFCQHVGIPPYAWLAQYRVGRARALLAAGRTPAQAASAVGFADQAHLTRWFRRVVGITPGVYRNSVQDGSAPRG